MKDSQGNPDPSVRMTTGFEAGRVAVDGNGNVYVTDAAKNTVYEYNTNWRNVRQFGINRAFAVGVPSSGETVYVGGSMNKANSIFILNNNAEKKAVGNLGVNWQEPTDMALDSLDNIFVVDSGKGIVREFGADGVIKKEFGPYGGERYASETIDGIARQRTRHRMVFPQGVAVDEASGLLYVTVKEFVEYLSNVQPGIDSNSYADSESWQYYNFTLGLSTDSNYKYWYPVSTISATKYQIIAIDIRTGEISKRIFVGHGSDFADFGLPKGLALDGKGRLYVAVLISTSAGGEIRVYDVNTGSRLSVDGVFDSGMYLDVAFHPDADPGTDPAKAKGILYATMSGSNIVYAYSIDGGTNPANTAPKTPPVLFSPSDKSYVAGLPLSLIVKNGSDAENDPLVYGYEIKKGEEILTTGSGIVEGLVGMTTMTSSYAFVENVPYKWRAQAFDGNFATWSTESEFCVNFTNHPPETPVVNGPKNFGYAASLSWTASKDPDCYDTVTYSIQIAADEGFGAIVTTVSGGGASMSLTSLKGILSHGKTYYWRVKAIDNRGGESSFGTGSFTYRTTVASFKSSQPETKIYIDGNYAYSGRFLGVTGHQAGVALDVQDITPGSHFVTFIKPGYEPVYKILNLSDPVSDPSGSIAVVTATMLAAEKIKHSGTGHELMKTGVLGSAPFVVDYNNDGLKDLVVGSTDGRVYRYISEEQPQPDGSKKIALVEKGPIQADGTDVNVSSRAVPFMADYNNDGKKDLLVGNSDGYISLFLNNGEENNPSFTSAGTIKDRDNHDIKALNSAPVIVDYNNDGKKDLVIGCSDGTIRLYLNTGSDAAPEYANDFHVIAVDSAPLAAGSNSKPFFVDWNNDGKKDLVVGRGAVDNEGNTVNLYLNTGTDESPVFRSIAGLRQWIREKKRDKGNREYVPYNGYNQDLGDPTQGSGEAAPFVANIDGSSARDLVAGNGSGSIIIYSGE